MREREKREVRETVGEATGVESPSPPTAPTALATPQPCAWLRVGWLALLNPFDNDQIGRFATDVARARSLLAENDEVHPSTVHHVPTKRWPTAESN